MDSGIRGLPGHDGPRVVCEGAGSLWVRASPSLCTFFDFKVNQPVANPRKCVVTQCCSRDYRVTDVVTLVDSDLLDDATLVNKVTIQREISRCHACCFFSDTMLEAQPCTSVPVDLSPLTLVSLVVARLASRASKYAISV